MEGSFVIGPRQTVDRAKHPTLGEGIAVYENGPAFFRPDDGEPVAMRRVGLGGAGSLPRPHSYRSAVTMAGEEIQLDTTGRQRGDSHLRAFSPILGVGWLVSVARNISAPDREEFQMLFRFEPDAGNPVTLDVRMMEAGRPGALKRAGRKALPASEENWLTYTTRGGDVMAFYRGEEPPKEAVATPSPKARRGGQTTIGAVK